MMCSSASFADLECFPGVGGAAEGMHRAWEQYLTTPTGRRDQEADTIRSTLAAYAAAAAASSR